MACFFTYKGCQCNSYAKQRLNCFTITILTRPKIGDAHFQNGAVTMQHAVLPIKAAKPMVMLNSDSITSQLPYLHDQKLLTLR